METPKKTLLDYLRVPNPEVHGKTCPGGTNSSSKSNKWLLPRAINKWEEFEFDTLTAIYNGDLYRVLQEEFDLQDFSTVPDFPFRQFNDENSLESLLIKWNQSVVTEALDKSQAKLENSEHRVYMVRGGQATFSAKEIKSRPDWACIQLPNPNLMERQCNLLPGDTKVSTKWSSALIKYGETNNNGVSMDKMRPLMQIYSYCLNSMSRYGYILSDKEVVAVRVRLNQDSDSQRTFEGFDSRMDIDDRESLAQRADEVGVIDIKAIPWNSGSSTTGLTVNLALWWLHLLASGDNAIADEKTYGALRDDFSPIWGSVVPDLDSLVMPDLEPPAVTDLDSLVMPNLGPPGPSQARPHSHRNGKKRAKSRVGHKQRSFDSSRASKDGIVKRGGSQGPRSAKNSFERR